MRQALNPSANRLRPLPALLLALCATATGGQAGPAPRFDVRMYAAVESLAPGLETELAVELDVARPWHIYHPILLDTGMPTTLEFTVPAGVTLGTPRFPTPKLGSTGGIEYLELSGKHVVLIPLRVAGDASPGPAAIGVNVSALACTDLCVPVSAKATLQLPITGAAGKAANAAIFEAARARLPASLPVAAYLKGSSVSIARSTLKVGETSEIVVALDVQSGHHIQDRDPGVEGLIPTRVFIESRDGLTIADDAKQLWPEPKIIDRPAVGKTREHAGAIAIRIPVTLEDPKFPGGPVELRVLVQYQACNEAGQCFPPAMAEAVVRFTADTGNPPDARRALFRVGNAAADASGGATSPAGGTAARGATSKTGFWLALLLGFFGGMLLNVMPCVLPVISIKILSFVQQSADDPRRVLRLGLAFSAGIMVWFWVFALISSLGGVPLQYPNVVIGISAVLLVMSLSLFGVFELALPGAAAGSLDAFASGEGYLGAFFKGLLATLLGTACTAPLLAEGYFYAASQPLAIALLVFSAAGVGMALPYLLLSANPALLRFLPKPGKWMITFKQSMGFVLLATVVWLLSVLGHQLGAGGVVWTVCFFCFLGLSAWLMGKISPVWSPGARWGTWIAALLISAGGWAFSYLVMYTPEARGAQGLRLDVDSVVRHVSERGWERGIPWVPYRKGLAQELAARGYTTYVDFTAVWCLNCKTNLGVSVDIESSRALMKELGVIPIEADFSNPDPEMESEIRAHAAGVPLNLIFPAGQPDQPIKVEPNVFLPSDFHAALRRGGPSTPVPPAEDSAPRVTP